MQVSCDRSPWYSRGWNNVTVIKGRSVNAREMTCLHARLNLIGEYCFCNARLVLYMLHANSDVTRFGKHIWILINHEIVRLFACRRSNLSYSKQ